MDREFETNPRSDRQLQAERLQTEYSFEDLETAEERLAGIRTQLRRWWLLGLAGFFSCLALLLSLNIALPLAAFLLPFIINDCYLAAGSMRVLLAKSDPRLFREYVKSVLENTSTIFFKVLLVVYFSYQRFPLWVAALPLFAVAVFRVAYRGPAGTECWAFSGMFRVAFRVVRIAVLITISIKIDGYATYSWLSALWPLWVSLSLLVLITIGVLLLLIGSIFSWMMHECERGEVVCALWLLIATGGLSASSGLCLFVFAHMEDGELTKDHLSLALIAPIIYFGVFLMWTRCMETRLVMWWDSFFTPAEDDQGVMPFRTIPQTPVSSRSRVASRQLTTLITSAPRVLTRISSTFFRPARRRGERRSRPQSLVNPQLFCKANEEAKVTSVSTLEMDNHGESSIEPEKPHPPKACLVCCEGMSNVVIMPCGHSGICKQCAVQVWKQTGQCFLCRRPIESVLEISSEQGNNVHVVRETCEKVGEDWGKERTAQE